MASSILQIRGAVTATGGAAIIPTGTPQPATNTWRFAITQDSTVAGDTSITVTLTDFLKKIQPGTAVQKAARGEVILIPRNKAFHDASVRCDMTNLGTGSFVLACESASGLAQYDVVVKYEHSLEV